MSEKKIVPPEIKLISSQVPRPCALNIRLTKSERDVVEKTAKKFKISISDLVRSILIQTMEHMLQQPE